MTLEESQRCGVCGVGDHVFAEDPGAYVAKTVVCPWCAMKDRTRMSNKNQGELPGSAIKLLPRAAIEQMAARGARRPLSARERA